MIESYKTIIEFRDKFAKQLELKIRDLQQSEATGELPLSLEFLSIEKGELVGNNIKYKLDHPQVNDFDEVPQDKRKELKEVIAKNIKQNSYFPVALAIENSSPSGIRNLYIELDISASSGILEVTDSIGSSFIFTSDTIFWPHKTEWLTESQSAISEEVETKLSRFDADKLQNTDFGWRLSFEWEALQPQRIRLIKPVLYVYTPEPANLLVKAKIFADSFPEPFVLEAVLKIDVSQKDIALQKLIPNWKKLIEKNESK